MTSFFSTMPMAQSQRPLQFIPYTRPPGLKPAPRRVQVKKVPPSDDEYYDIDDFLAIEPNWNAEGGNGEELAHTAHAVGVVDATCSATNEANYEIGGSRRGIVDVSSNDTTNEGEDVSIPTTREASQLPPSAGSSEGSQGQENSIAVFPESPQEDCVISSHDVISPKSDESRADRSVSVPQQGLGLAPRARAGSESLYLTSSDSGAQDVVPPSDSSSITEKQPQNIERVISQSESPALEFRSRVSDSESDSNSDNKGHAWRLRDTQVVRKRKHGALVYAIANKRRSHKPKKTSKLRPTAAADTAKQQKQLHHPRRSRNAQSGTCNPKIRCGDDTSTEDSSDDIENHHNNRSAKAGNSKKAYKLDFDCGSPSEDTKYEVDQILAVRLRHGNLQYRVLWVGYEADPNWYNTSNFKNSPRKLQEFHEAKPTKPGPPARLSHWEQCWEEDRDANDYPDDDQPSRTAGKGRTVKSGRTDT